MTTYTCPMHPEIVSDTRGRCPKCGMALVEKGSADTHAHHEMQEDDKTYTPLIVIVLLLTVASGILAFRPGEGFLWLDFVTAFMTGFFLVFGAFKLMDLKGFAEGYQTYDLIAARLPAYAYVYPFIELFFGFSMLAGYMPEWLLWAEILVMAVSGLGVALKLARREKFQCACLGTFLKVPLTTVTLIEDFGMAALAALLLIAGAA